VSGNFSVSSSVFPAGAPSQDFNNLTANLSDLAEQILDYELDIYICTGTSTEKKNWFDRINTSGEPLNTQELLNASHTGKWLSDAKAYFSKADGRGVKLANTNPDDSSSEPLLKGEWNRQDYLATAIRWHALAEDFTGKDAVEQYMNAHGGDSDASELWQYFSQVLEWVRGKFITYNKALAGLDWGAIYNAYRNGFLSGNIIEKSADEIQEAIVNLLNDKEVTASMSGIYKYIIYGDGKYLSIREFDDETKMRVYQRQNHHCPYCLQEGSRQEFFITDMHADHIIPWSKGGKTVESNCQMLCKKHNLEKGNRW